LTAKGFSATPQKKKSKDENCDKKCLPQLAEGGLFLSTIKIPKNFYFNRPQFSCHFFAVVINYTVVKKEKLR